MTRSPYNSLSWQTVLGLAPQRCWYAVIEACGRRHITNTVPQRDEWLAQWEGATTTTLVMGGEAPRKEAQLPCTATQDVVVSCD